MIMNNTNNNVNNLYILYIDDILIPLDVRRVVLLSFWSLEGLGFRLFLALLSKCRHGH